jgi:Na+-driven multidrug efflux pump
MTLGIAVGVQPILGYNYSSGQYRRVKQTYALAMLATTLIMSTAFLVFQLCPTAVMRLFGEESAFYVEFGVKCLRIYLLLCWTIGVGTVTGIFFQALGKPFHAAFLSLSRQVIFLIPSILILPRIFGVEGALWAGPVSDGFAFAASLILVAASWKTLFSPGGIAPAAHTDSQA